MQSSDESYRVTEALAESARLRGLAAESCSARDPGTPSRAGAIIDPDARLSRHCRFHGASSERSATGNVRIGPAETRSPAMRGAKHTETAGCRRRGSYPAS